MSAADIGLGLLHVREAHRHCVDRAHGGHDFEECPVLAQFRALVKPVYPSYILDTMVTLGPNSRKFVDVAPAVEIRSTNPYGFRSGEWALVTGVEWANDRPCYLVRFPDGETDVWVVVDPSDPYEFRPAPVGVAR